MFRTAAPYHGFVIERPSIASWTFAGIRTCRRREEGHAAHLPLVERPVPCLCSPVHPVTIRAIAHGIDTGFGEPPCNMYG